jgi:hypothetical protein
MLLVDDARLAVTRSIAAGPQQGQANALEPGRALAAPMPAAVWPSKWLTTLSATHTQ